MKKSQNDLITRRTALAAAGCVAGATISGLPGPLQAAVPAAGRQVPGIYRYKIGSFELTSINDGINAAPLKEGFVRNAAMTDVEAALHDAFLPAHVLNIPFTQLVVNTGKKVVLIDTGTGGQMAATAGMLIENVEAAGLDPKAVDTVLISHFHGDHILGLRTKDGEAAFPNAEVVVPDLEWKFWMDEGEMSRAPQDKQGAFKNVRRMFEPMAKDIRRYVADGELVAGIVAQAAYGHTPGHMAFRISSGDEQMMVLSDTANHPALFVRHPGWHAAFDMDPIMAEASRRRIFDTISADRTLVQGYHFPFPAIGHIAKEAEGYAFVPSSWNPVL